MGKQKKNILMRFIADEDGATAVEYGVLIVFIAIGVVLGMQSVTGDNMQRVFEILGTFFQDAVIG